MIAKAVLAAGVAAAAVFAPGVSAQASTGVANGDAVNVRVAPSTDAQIVDKLADGQRVEPFAIEGDWIKLSTAAMDAVYVKQEFVTIQLADGIVNDVNVNVRAAASTSSEVLGQVTMGERLILKGREGAFYAFDINGKTAYIHQDFVISTFGKMLPAKEVKAAAAPKAAAAEPAPVAAAPKVETTYALVLSDNGMNLRSAPDVGAPVLAVLSYGEAADLLEEGNEWNKVSYLGSPGYLNAEYTVVKTGVKPESGTRGQLVNFAKKYLGTRYVWGGTNLNSGVDCSGFTTAVFRAFGITLYRSSHEQVNNGPKVAKADLVAGDLVFFSTGGGGISHVGIYIGGNEFIHASSSSRTPYVTINSLYDDYYMRNYITACRVLR